jgi:hypothetical protein
MYYLLFYLLLVPLCLCLGTKDGSDRFDKFENSRMKSEQWTMVADKTIRPRPMCPITLLQNNLIYFFIYIQQKDRKGEQWGLGTTERDCLTRVDWNMYYAWCWWIDPT